MDRLATGIMLVWHAMFGINSLIDPAEMVSVILGTRVPSKDQVSESRWHASKACACVEMHIAQQLGSRNFC